MPLTPGTRLGSYEVVAALGAGGMGEVYRAHDSRLRRDVAIKVLPAAFAGDAERLRRFEQEALATAALNHPNILAVYDVGREGDTTFVVAELLDGETLREKLAGQIGVKKVVDYAVQIATGLAAAHGKGIVHRDLKPENIFVTRDERVKILDFGLAKTVALARQSGASTMMQPASAGAAGAAAGTEPGLVLGTVGYMAPEQVRALPADHRADIFSLGTVLYEMLSGRRAFAGDTTADTMTAILKESPPDLTTTGRAIPPALERIVSRCLEKDPSARFQSASDLAFALQSSSAHSGSGSGVVAAASVAPRAGISRAALVAIALVAGLTLGAAAAAMFWRPRAGAGVAAGAPIRFTISATDGIAVDDLTRAVVSPDGQYLAIAQAVATSRQLTILALATGDRRDLGEMSPGGVICWSPDSTTIAYFGTDRALYKLSLSGLQRQRLAPLAWAPSSLSWSPKGEIFAAGALSGDIVAVPSSGGAPRTVITGNAGGSNHSVQVLPDGNRLVLSRGGGGGQEIVLATVDGSHPPRVVGQGMFPTFFEPDILLAVRGNNLVAWRTTLDGAPLSGDPVVIATGVLMRVGSAMMPFSASASGLIVYRSESQEGRTRLTWFDRGGRAGESLALRGHCRNPEMSPAFDRVAVECWDPAGGRDIWIYDLARDGATRITTDPADDADPLWTPDGLTVLFASNRLGPVDVFKTGAGGARPEELVIQTERATPITAISPDGRHLLVLTTGLEASSGIDLEAYRLDVKGPPTAVLKSAAAEVEAQFSPDGRFISYASNQTGRSEVYVEPWPQTGARWTVSTGGGTDARWRPDGSEIYYFSPDRRLMAAPVRTTGTFTVGRPVELFQTRVAGPLGIGHRFPFAIDKDGQRFLIYVTDADSPPPAISAIANWRAVLGR